MGAWESEINKAAELSRAQRLHRGFRRLAIAGSIPLIFLGGIALIASAIQGTANSDALPAAVFAFSFAAAWCLLCYGASWIVRGFMRD